MYDGIEYIQLEKAQVSQNVLSKFDCGHSDFNDFLHNDAKTASIHGDGVTYILVDKDEIEKKNITTIFAFITIQTSALHYYKDENNKVCKNYNNDNGKLFYISCVEIKYFAIASKFQNLPMTGLLKTDKHFSYFFFQVALQNLHMLSMNIVGFKMIFLRANEKGEKLYSRSGFSDCSEYIIPYEESDEDGICTPMGFLISEKEYCLYI